MSYSKLEKEIHEYFGEDWVEIPLYDATSYYWILTENECGGEITYLWGRCSSSNQQFTSKKYRTTNYTMISVDTQAECKKYLMVFDNAKECKDVIAGVF